MPEGSVCVFSAHGVAPSVHANAQTRGLRTIDATCPLVTKVHREALRFAEDGYTIVLVGHDGHEEVEGTMGEAPERIVLVQIEQDVDELEVEDPERIAYVTQTTLSVDETELDPRPSERALPEPRRSPHRRHLLRHDQPPDGRQAARRQLRSDARDRLAQLLELGAPGRGRARLRHRRAPDRQRERGPRGVARGTSASSASPRAPARPRTSSASWSASSAREGCEDISEVDAVREDVRFMLPKQVRDEAVVAVAGERLLSTLIVSDLHLGSGLGSDVLRRPGPRAALLEALEDIDRLVLLGDVLELRHRPPRYAMAAARPFFEDLGRVLAGREIVVSAGNHDHLLVESWLGERALQAPEPLGLEQRLLPEQASPMLAQLAEWAAPAQRERRLPGPVGAPRRLCHARPLPRLPSDRAHDRAPERRRDEPRAGASRPRPSAASRTTRRWGRRCSRGATPSPGKRVPAALLNGRHDPRVARAAGERRLGRQAAAARWQRGVRPGAQAARAGARGRLPARGGGAQPRRAGAAAHRHLHR